jgi:hypothetical protein
MLKTGIRQFEISPAGTNAGSFLIQFSAKRSGFYSFIIQPGANREEERAIRELIGARDDERAKN